MKKRQYVIDGGVAGHERLRLLSEVLGPPTRALLSTVGIREGSSCLDVGCGGGDVTFELAHAAGANGRALGVDQDQVKVDRARQEGGRRGFTNIAFETCDVTGWEPGEPFDVIYARFLLTHLAHPEGMVATMRRHLRPGGVIIVEDIDFRGHFSEPDCAALRRYVELYSASVRSRGADPDIGPRLPGLLREAGLQDVQMSLVQPAALEGGIKLLTCVTLETIAETVVGDGLIEAEELQETIADLYAFARNPQTVLGGPRIFQAWASSAG